MKHPALILAIMLLIPALLSACGSIVKEADYAPSPNIPENAHPIPVKYSGLELLLPPGMNIGTERGGLFCHVPGYPVNRNVLQKEIDHKFLRQSFHDALEANGYDVVGSLDVAFDPEDEEQRAEYSIKGKLKDAQIDMCTSAPGNLYFFSPNPGEHGRLYLAIDWSVYDILRRKVVYKTRTEGFTERGIPNQEGLSLMFNDAFEMAAHNLAADENFRALIIDDVKPPPEAGGETPDPDNRPRLFDPDEDVAIPDISLSRQPFAKTNEEGRKAVVTVQKSGHGSGVFITPQGHILTNAHVVGEARRMRIVTADKKHKLTAEVLRVDRARDVALLKLEELPEGMKITTLPVRLDWPKVGEDVYAIGTPRDVKLLHDTVTKGIISAHRRAHKILGVRENYLQADVDVHAGNSGGPLVDEYGNLVGLTVIGLEANEGIGNGLNLFIPIGEALDRLHIDY